jgi:hypothetical protein
MDFTNDIGVLDRSRVFAFHKEGWIIQALCLIVSYVVFDVYGVVGFMTAEGLCVFGLILASPNLSDYVNPRVPIIGHVLMLLVHIIGLPRVLWNHITVNKMLFRTTIEAIQQEDQ